jgi:quinolinate synthase
LIFVPDRNLGRWIAQFVPEKHFIFWEGFCPSHERMTLQDVLSKKAQFPGAVFVCHPESAPEVSAVADHVCSTSGMYEWCRASPAQQFIIGTEPGILYRLRRDNPEKEFILAAPALVCPNMKLTSLDDVLAALQTMSPVVTVDPEVRRKARAALDRMLAVPRD